MVILLQLVLVALVVLARRNYLFGGHLKASKTESGTLSFIVRNKEGDITRQHIGIKRTGGIPFIVRRERFYHKFFKWVGMATELHVPDRELDRKYFFITDFPHHLEKMMHSTDLLDHIRELLVADVKSIHVVGDRLWCVLGPNARRMSTYQLRGHVELLERIHEDTQEVKSSPIERANLRRGLLAFGFMIVHATLMGLGLGGVFTFLLDDLETIEHTQMVGFSIVMSIVLICCWSVLITALFARSSWVCWVWTDFLLWGVVGIVFSCMVMVRDINVNLPQAEATVVSMPVVSKVCTLKCRKSCGRRCTRTETHKLEGELQCAPEAREVFMQQRKTSSVCAASAWYEYEIRTPWWKEYKGKAKKPYFIADVNVDVFDSAREKGFIKVPVHPGALGFDWVDMSEVRP
ncbi:MAG: hypothetical protein DI585_07230 [Pseudomonas fluorescens]|nr:MAG: hypothetical protein DI585_07230 [Pseudomonas fluorescens]